MFTIPSLGVKRSSTDNFLQLTIQKWILFPCKLFLYGILRHPNWFTYSILVTLTEVILLSICRFIFLLSSINSTFLFIWRQVSRYVNQIDLSSNELTSNRCPCAGLVQDSVKLATRSARTLEVFTNSAQYKNVNIANFLLAVPLKIYWTTEVSHLEM